MVPFCSPQRVGAATSHPKPHLASQPRQRHDAGMPTASSSTDQRLRHFIAQRMRMSHVYQPLMLMELLGRHSPAPAKDVARRILGEDVTQIEDTTERVKRMVGRVLTGTDINHARQEILTLEVNR